MSEKVRDGFPLRGRSREWLTLFSACLPAGRVESTMSSLAKPLREKPPLFYRNLGRKIE